MSEAVNSSLSEEPHTNRKEVSVQSNSRWWEFYFVRYTLGTLVGALFVHLIAKANPEIEKLLFFAQTGSKESIANAPLLGVPVLIGYGLAFCYIASIPILIFHAGRMAFWGALGSAGAQDDQQALRTESKRWNKYEKLSALALLITAIGFFCKIVVISFPALERGFRDDEFVTGFLFISASLVVVLQVLTVFLILLRRNAIYIRMKMLASAREENRNKGEFIDSYRHLREHGNSILILILEAILGGCLLGIVYTLTGNPEIENELRHIGSASFVLLLFWVLPGGCVWIFASWIEAKFASEKLPKADTA